MSPAAVPFAVLIGAAAACAAPASQEADSAPAAAAADLALGERVFRQCHACHSTEPGANTPAGPTLHGIVGRPVAAEPGFNYSPALRRLAGQHPRWTPDLIDRFLADPAALAPGNEMGFPGLEDPEARRAVIAWLSQ